MRDPAADLARAATELAASMEGNGHGMPQLPPSPEWQESPWPEPLAGEASHGLAGEIVRAIEPHTEADPAALLVQFLVSFGSAVGRRPYLRIEGDRHYPNLFGVMVGATSKGRKGTSFGRIREIMSEAAPKWQPGCIVSGLSSGEGLIWQVRDAITKHEPVKDKGRVVSYQDVEVDPGVADKRLLVQEAEFASVLRHLARQGNTLSAIIRDAWDRGNLRALTKNSPAQATDAHISIVGHITADELRRYLDRTEAGNGFANRFLYACVRRSKRLPEGGGNVAWGYLPGRLAEVLARAQAIGEVGRTAEARALWREVYAELSEGKPGLFGAVIARAEAQTMRLALIYALLDGSAVIEAEHLLAALAVWRYCEASARHVFGNSMGDPTADGIMQALHQSPAALSRTEISGLFGRHVESNQLSRALALLAAQGLVVRETVSTGGRPAELWRAA